MNEHVLELLRAANAVLEEVFTSSTAGREIGISNKSVADLQFAVDMVELTAARDGTLEPVCAEGGAV